MHTDFNDWPATRHPVNKLRLSPELVQAVLDFTEEDEDAQYTTKNGILLPVRLSIESQTMIAASVPEVLLDE